MAEGGELKNFMVTLLIISAFIMAMGVFISDVETNYVITQDQAMPDGDFYFTNTSQEIESIQADLDTEIEGSQGEDNLLLAAWKMLKKVYGSTKIMGNLVGAMSKAFPIPEALQGIVGIFIAIITVVIIFAIIGVVTRTRSP